MNTSHTISVSDIDKQDIDLENYNLEGLKIMLVDDSKTILRSAEMFLAEKKGCQVITAEDGFESLSLISKDRPDIIFMDIMMPKLDGYQTCALIKSNEEYADIPVIMLSSKHNLFDMARGRLSGSEKYLTKPFTHDDLIGAIVSHIHATDEDVEEVELPVFV
jgi:twitching motility two-component system response regulator PilG